MFLQQRVRHSDPVLFNALTGSLPAIGPAARDARVTYAFGHGHLGLTQAASTARLVADLMAGRPSALDLAPFRPQRFA
jgi:D-amino-acid dehydrogenase